VTRLEWLSDAVSPWGARRLGFSLEVATQHPELIANLPEGSSRRPDSRDVIIIWAANKRLFRPAMVFQDTRTW